MKKFSIYKIISILAFVALIFILALPNFFDINKKQETEQCIKNMRAVYAGAESYLATEQRDFSGTTTDLERMGYLNKAYECPSEAPGDKYHVRIVAETGEIEVRCVNEINSSPQLTVNSFEDFVYFLNIIKFHQKPTSEFIYGKLSAELQQLLAEHEAYSTSLFNTRTVLDWDKFMGNLRSRRNDHNLDGIWEGLSAESQEVIANWHRIDNPLTIEQKEQIIEELNTNVVAGYEFSETAVKSVSLDKEGKKLYARGYNDMNQLEKQRFNRLMLEVLFPYEFQVGSKYNYPSDELQDLLVEELNNMLYSNAFNTAEFINEIKLSGETVKRVEEQPNSRIDMALTNRLLLQDAYPTLLVKYEDLYSSHRFSQN